jgi:nucleoside phosphorylase
MNEPWLQPDEYTVGWICALPIEMMAAKVMLDNTHKPPQRQSPTDTNAYQLGRIGGHNVVIACLPAGSTGTTSAATVAAHMRTSFPSVSYGLMVGIGGGVPRKTRNTPDDDRDYAGALLGFEDDGDIRLGDVVVSQPVGTFGGVVQYDFGKAVGQGRFVRTGQLDRPPSALLTALSSLQSNHGLNGNAIASILAHVAAKFPRLRAAVAVPTRYEDLLFEADYDHDDGLAGPDGGSSSSSSSGRSNSLCQRCDRGRLVRRPPRVDDYAAAQAANVGVALAAVPAAGSSAAAGQMTALSPLPSPQPLPPAQPLVRYGLIASGNQVMRHGATRDRINQEADGKVLCFEMEAAGLMNDFPCLVVRGICDYADSHKNKAWQEYAALTAAAYAKELLEVLPATAAVASHERGGAGNPVWGGHRGFGGGGAAGGGHGQNNSFENASIANRGSGNIFVGAHFNGGHGSGPFYIGGAAGK